MFDIQIDEELKEADYNNINQLIESIEEKERIKNSKIQNYIYNPNEKTNCENKFNNHTVTDESLYGNKSNSDSNNEKSEYFILSIKTTKDKEINSEFDSIKIKIDNIKKNYFKK